MRRSVLAGAMLAAAVTTMVSVYANAQEFHAKFSGFNEIGPLGAGETGAIFSQGQATLKLKLNTNLQTLNWTLTYSDLGAPITQAHIHFGKVHVAGGIMVFFCANPPVNPPAGTQLCPPSGTISGMFTGGSVIGPTLQNIKPGDFNALAQALLSKTAYGNIHTTAFPAGEIRGEIRRDEDDQSNQDHQSNQDQQ